MYMLHTIRIGLGFLSYGRITDLCCKWIIFGYLIWKHNLGITYIYINAWWTLVSLFSCGSAIGNTQYMMFTVLYVQMTLSMYNGSILMTVCQSMRQGSIRITECLPMHHGSIQMAVCLSLHHGSILMTICLSILIIVCLSMHHRSILIIAGNSGRHQFDINLPSRRTCMINVDSSWPAIWDVARALVIDMISV